MAGHNVKIPELDAKGLRNFGISTGAIIAGLFGLFLPWLFEHSLPRWPWIIFAVLAVWGLAAPTTLKPVYRGWMRLGLMISRITTPLVLGIVFYLVIMPFGIVHRFVAKDPMARKFDENAESYRVPSEQQSSDNLENPY